LILCADNDAPHALNARAGGGDIIENRPPLSRWHKDYAEGFKEVGGEK